MSSKVSIFASAVLVLAAAPALAQNLIVNPGFATDISSWRVGVTFISAVWQPLDATGQSNSGSIAITNSFPGLSNGADQCVPVTAGGHYDFGARVAAAPGSPQPYAVVNVIWSTGPNCGGTPVGNELSTPAIPSGSTVFSGVSATSQVAPAGAQSADVYLSVSEPPGANAAGTAYFDDVYFQASGGCTPEATNLCLNQGRFKLTATFDAGGGNAGQAQAVKLTDDTGYLWFFAAANVEVVAKVIDGCGLGGHYWVFAGGLTNVAVVITVTDTQTGSTRTYTNPQDQAFQPLQDTAAFSTCP
jgi:hypothetical protein